MEGWSGGRGEERKKRAREENGRGEEREEEKERKGDMK